MELKTPEKEIELGKIEYNEDGTIKIKKASNVSQGKKSRSAGARFELKVREDLNSKNWIVDKWSNNVDLEKEELAPAKRKMRFINRSMKVMTIGTGFPDFLAFQRLDGNNYKIIGVEVKVNGTLSKIEKEKCAWYLKRKIFSEILIAKQKKNGRRIEVVSDA